MTKIKQFDYQTLNHLNYSSDLVNKMNQIYNLRGKTDSYETDYRDTLDRLVEVAKIQSTSSSNRIEGIYTTDERMNKIMQDRGDEKKLIGLLIKSPKQQLP